MSMDDGGLTRREHDEMRDLVLAGTQRIRPAGSHRTRFVAAGVALVLVGAVTGGVVTTAIDRGDQPQPVSTNDSRPVPGANGWVAFSMGWPDRDIYIVDETTPARRIVGSDDDGIDEICPAFSSDGTRFGYGAAMGNWNDGYQDAALIVADATADGSLANVESIDLDGMDRPPCPVWSPDGRWVAFGAGTTQALVPFQSAVEQVWLVETETGGIRRLTDLSATDIEWARDSSQLYIASKGVLTFSLATGETRQVGDMADAHSIAVSPHDGSIAVERLPRVSAPSQLWLMNPDGSDQRVLLQSYSQMHGIGPVWSPDGSRIALQQTCSEWVDGVGTSRYCREEHEVVVVTVGESDPLGPPGTETVIAPPYTTDGNAPGTWFPWSVTWSPDGTRLLYLAWHEPDRGAVPAVEGEADRVGLVTVHPDSSALPAILHDGFNVGVYTGYPWNSFQSWQSR